MISLCHNCHSKRIGMPSLDVARLVPVLLKKCHHCYVTFWEAAAGIGLSHDGHVSEGVRQKGLWMRRPSPVLQLVP